MKLFLILLIISACSLIKAPQNKFQKQWIGQAVSVLNNHPQFSLFLREELFINKREIIINYLSTVFVDDEKLSCIPLNDSDRFF